MSISTVFSSGFLSLYLSVFPCVFIVEPEWQGALAEVHQPSLSFYQGCRCCCCCRSPLNTFHRWKSQTISKTIPLWLDRWYHFFPSPWSWFSSWPLFCLWSEMSSVDHCCRIEMPNWPQHWLTEQLTKICKWSSCLRATKKSDRDKYEHLSSQREINTAEMESSSFLC